MVKAKIVGAVLALLAVLVPPRVLAQTSESGGQEARELFERGLRSVEEEAFAEAVVLFHRSLELVPRVSTALNLALAQRSLGDALEARSTLTRLLDGGFGPVESQMRRLATRELEAIDGEIGRLVVRVRGGQSVQITIDGGPVGTLDAPGQIEVPINPGTRAITASSADHRPARERVEVAAGATVEVELELVPAIDERPGILRLESTDPSAMVEIEGVGRARGQLERELIAGEYTVRVIGDDGSEESRVVVPPGRRTRLVLEPPTRGFFDQPLVWIGIGLAAAAVAGGTIYVVANRTRDPVVDPFWGNTQALGPAARW